MQKFISLIAIGLVAGCATTMTNKAAQVQVHSQMSTLLANCKVLGPVYANGEDFWVGGVVAVNKAKMLAREIAADKGADTFVITNIDTLSATTATVQGTAMRCN